MYKQAVMFAGALLEMLAGMRHKRIILTAVILLLTSATALGIYRHYRVDAKRKHAQELLAKANDPKLSAAERDKQRRELRNAVQQLPEDQRRDLMRPMFERMRREMDRRVATYMALRPDQRDAFLDAQLAEMERRRQEAEARPQQTNAAASQGGQGGQPNGGRGNQSGIAGQRRMDRMKQMLDSSTPGERASRQIYFQALSQRAAQTGMSMPGGRGGGGFF